MLLEVPQRKSLIGPFIALLALSSPLPAATGGAEVSAIGAIEIANCRARTVTVLGINFVAKDAESIAAICDANSSADRPYVSITGSIGPNGLVRLKKLANISVGQYVPGATPVYLSGNVSISRTNLGTVEISGATVMLNRSDVVAGSVVETVGTQPLLGGAVLPDVVRITVPGSSVNLGTNPSSSIGSGASTNSSIGSGKSLNSSIGSGASTNSSIGSGVSLNSSIGSGASTNSSIGSGKSLNSSIGSGASTNSSIGSGKSLNSSIGSGSTSIVQ